MIAIISVYLVGDRIEVVYTRDGVVCNGQVKAGAESELGQAITAAIGGLAAVLSQTEVAKAGQ